MAEEVGAGVVEEEGGLELEEDLDAAAAEVECLGESAANVIALAGVAADAAAVAARLVGDGVGKFLTVRVGGSGVGSSPLTSRDGGGGLCMLCLNVTTSSSSSPAARSVERTRGGVVKRALFTGETGIGATSAEGVLGVAAGALRLTVDTDAGDPSVFGETFLPHELQKESPWCTLKSAGFSQCGQCAGMAPVAAESDMVKQRRWNVLPLNRERAAGMLRCV